MYLIAIAWIYVVLLMSIAEATNSNGTVLGALITFLLYGLLPLSLVLYVLRTPARKRAIKAREKTEESQKKSP
jgi:mannose/fructose/N-acetylgalactosamine-specific phosphotransferase system component IID